jgi:hypothetical protein
LSTRHWNFGFHRWLEISWIVERLLASQELCSLTSLVKSMWLNLISFVIFYRDCTLTTLNFTRIM